MGEKKGACVAASPMQERRTKVRMFLPQAGNLFLQEVMADGPPNRADSGGLRVSGIAHCVIFSGRAMSDVFLALRLPLDNSV